MRHLLIIAYLFIVFDCFSQKDDFHYARDFHALLNRTNDNSDSLFYGRQIKRFIQNDSTLTDFEVLALMIGFTSSPSYNAYADVSVEREIYQLNSEGEFKAALQKGLDFNKTHPLNQMTLIELSYSYYKLGKQDSANYYSYQFTKIMDAMASSGKGTHPDSAYFALTPIDGQNFIRKFLRGRIGTMGSVRDSHGNFVDILEYIPQDKEVGIPLYFQIQHAMRGLQKELQKPSEQQVSMNLDTRTQKHVEELLSDHSVTVRTGGRVYKKFRKFKRSASTEELLQLLKHYSPEIRIYSFWALKDKNYPNLERFFNEQAAISEETFLYYIDRGGSTLEVEEATVSSFIRKLLNNEIQNQ